MLLMSWCLHVGFILILVSFSFSFYSSSRFDTRYVRHCDENNSLVDSDLLLTASNNAYFIHQIFLSEYAIVWATFIAIQVVGIDVGIVLGVLVAIVNHVVATAQISGVHRVAKQSRAVWTPKDYKLLHAHGYHPLRPKIVTLEIVGTVFFGSSLQLLERISEEIGLNIQQEEFDQDALLKSPHRTSYQISTDIRDRRQSFREIQPAKATVLRCQPQFVVLDLTLVPNLDASASRGCFLQLAKACAKKNIIVCAAGATPRVEWMLRSHDVAYDMEEEARVEAKLQARADTPGRLREAVTCDRVLLVRIYAVVILIPECQMISC